MDKQLNRIEISEGVHFNSVTDPRFKFNRITFGFYTPLSEETASLYALIPRLFSRSNKEYPKGRDFNNYLASLYNARSEFEVTSFGDTQFLGVSMNFMDDSYALHGERITEAAARQLFNCVFEPSLNDAGDAFVAEDVELCKREQVEAIEAELNDKRHYAANQAKRIVYAGEPAAVNPLGSVERTREVTPQGVFKAAIDLFMSAVIEIVCVGCNDFSDALKIAREFLTADPWDKRNAVPHESAYSPLKTETAERAERLPLLSQSRMVLAFKTDCKRLPVLSLMCNLYGGTISSKLFLNVRERLSLCYSCWSRLSQQKGVMSVNCGVEEANIDKAKAEILAQLENVKAGDFTDEELSNALLYEQNNAKTVNDSLGSMTWWYFTRIYMRDIKSPEQYLESYDNITREDIIQAAKSMSLDTFYTLSGEESGGAE
jgi:predicted Zn-dependent peptidase